MIVEQTPIPDLLLIRPQIHEDSRGYFTEVFRKDLLEKGNIAVDFVQENESLSKKNVLRGLHFQQAPFAQSKLIRCIQGEILDVAVDIRPSSATFLQYFKIRLSHDNKLQLFIPQGFAHGFLTLSSFAIVSYKVDRYRHQESERSIRYDDPSINIDWELTSTPILSEKDNNAPFLSL